MTQSITFLTLLILCGAFQSVHGQYDDGGSFSIWYIIAPVLIILKLLFWCCVCAARNNRTSRVRVRTIVRTRGIDPRRNDRRQLCNPQNQDLPDALDVRPTQHGQVPPPPYVITGNASQPMVGGDAPPPMVTGNASSSVVKEDVPPPYVVTGNAPPPTDTGNTPSPVDKGDVPPLEI